MAVSERNQGRLIDALKQVDIHDPAILNAFAVISRAHFIPPAMHDKALDDIAIPIGQGQTISQPSIVAKMCHALEVDTRHKILEIGTGTGYQACILSKLARRVYTIERHKPLHVQAEKNFSMLNIHNITSLHGDGMKGWPTIHGIDQAPFDRIIVAAAARVKPPPQLIEQLSIGGILVIPIGAVNEQKIMRYKKEADDLISIQELMPVRFVPLLPDIV